MIERSEPSIKLIEQTNPSAPFLEEIRETGNLPLDFQAIYDATVEMTNSDESKFFCYVQRIWDPTNLTRAEVWIPIGIRAP